MPVITIDLEHLLCNPDVEGIFSVLIRRSPSILNIEQERTSYSPMTQHYPEEEENIVFLI